jgi:hypothetical protein
MPMLKKRRVLAFKTETTPGTPIALTSAEACFCFNPIIQADIPMTKRDATGTLGQLAAVPGARAGKITFDIELAGAGATGLPKWSGLLAYCGMTLTTATYSPTSDPTLYSSATIAVYNTGIEKVLAGAMGTWSLEAEYGKPAMMKFEFTGIWQPPVDVTQIALPTYSVVPPRVANATFTLGAFTPKVSKLTLAQNNTLKLIEDISTISAYNRAIVTNRDYKGTLDPQQELVGTWDAFGDWIAGTESALSLAIGTVANNTMTFAAPKAQRANVQEADRDQLVTNNLDFQLNCSLPTGDNELTVAFS